MTRTSVNKLPSYHTDRSLSQVSDKAGGWRLLTGDRPSFVIAHHLSTVTQVDQVLVVQQGQIVERGTHAELLEKQGVYANLYALRLGNS
jgi:ABC-type multidrug transport system fused ATPase/permease subunit